METIGIAILNSLVCGIIGAVIAEFRGMSGRQGFTFGFFLGPIGLIFVCFMKKPEEESSTIQHVDPVMMTCSCGSEIPADSIPCPVSGRMYTEPDPYPAMQEDFVPLPARPQRKQPTGSPKAEYAYSLMRIGQKQQALPVLKELVREEPDNEKAWLSMYLCVDRKEQQKYCLQQALRINPGNKKAQQRLGKLHIPADVLQYGENSVATKNTPLTCAQCKMPLSPDSLFCENCGNPVIEEDTLFDDPLPPVRLPAAQYPAGMVQQNAWNPPVYVQPQIRPVKNPGAGRVFLAFLILMVTYFVLTFGQGFFL